MTTLLFCENQKAIATGKLISYSWSAGYRIATNGSHESEEELPREIIAIGSEINGTADEADIFPDHILKLDQTRSIVLGERNNVSRRSKRFAEEKKKRDDEVRN